MSRELAITYNSVSMSEAPRTVVGKWTHRLDRPAAAVATDTYSWVVLVTASTEAAFKTACADLEAAFAARFAALTIVYGGQTHVSLSHSGNTGFNAAPFCRKTGSPRDTGRSREYECGVTVQLPADDNTGRAWTQVDRRVGPNDQIEITISGQYTAQAGISARANYDSKIAALISAVTAAAGGTYGTIRTQASHDSENKLCDFTVELKEIIYAESSGGLDHASVKDATITYSRTDRAGEDAPGGALGNVRRMQDVVASFACAVPVDTTSDLHGLWVNTLRPYLLSEAKRFFAASTVILAEESPELTASANFVAGTVRLLISTTGTALLAYEVEQTIATEVGDIWVPRWTGNRLAFHVYPGHATTTRETVVTYRISGALSLDLVRGKAYVAGAVERGGGGESPPGGPYPARAGWRLIRQSLTRRPRRLGVPDSGYTLDVGDVVLRISERWGDGGGAGGGTVTGRSTAEGATGGGSTYVPGSGFVTPGSGVQPGLR